MDGLTLTWIIIGAAVVLLILLYNSFVVKKNNVENAFAAIDTQLKKRFDLIPNLVSSVKTYMNHESTTFERIAELRTKAMASGTTEDDRIQCGAELSGLVRKLMVQVENYPQLKANENFMHLQRTLNEVEEQLSAARRSYNAAVTEFNNAIQTFPGNLFAGIFGFKARVLFAVSEEERANPNVADLFK